MIRRHTALAAITSLIPCLAGAQEPVTAFVGVSVIPMDRERVLEKQTVVVRGDRVVALGPAKQVPVPAGSARIDGRGKFLIPGLGDMHVHLKDVDTVTAASLLFAFVANGVTTVRDMHSGGSESVPLQLRRRVAAGELLGPRIYTAGDPDPESPEAAAASVVALKAAGHDFVKVYDGGFWEGRYYDSVLAVANRVGLRVTGHVPPGVGLEEVLGAHWASIEHLAKYVNYMIGLEGDNEAVYAYNGATADTAAWLRPDYRLDPARLRHIAAATRRGGVWNCPTLVGVAKISLIDQLISRDGSGKGVGRRYLELDLQIVKALHDAGAGLLLGTDAIGIGSVLPGFSVHRELELMVEAGLTPYQALETGTRNVARFLGTEASSGTIAVGKRADLVLLTANPLRDIRATTALAGVMVGGHWLPRGELHRRLDGQGTEADRVAQLRTARDLLWR